MEGNGSKICDKRVHVNATRYARRPQICGGPLLYPRPGIHRYVQGISEGLRSTRILQNKRVCVKFLFQGMGRRRRGGGGGKGRRRRNSSGGCHCSAQPLDNANTPYSEAGWREARATNENSTEFETVRASDTYISREKRTRLCIEKGIDETNIYMCVYVYTYMYDAHNTELSIIHGSHDR